MSITATEQARRERRERLVLDHFADETRQSWDDVLETFPHPHYEIVATDEVHDGSEAVRGYYLASRRAFPDQRHEIIKLRHTEDAVVVEFDLLGTQRGPLNGLPPTNQAFRCRMAAFFVFEGDTLVCERVYFDSLTILRQLLAGLPPAMLPQVLPALLASTKVSPERATATA
jgi:steroid delta-isomerase-like uncharacterized protein